MKKILSAIVAVAFVAVATSALAGPPPETVTLKASSGNVVFNHKAHQGQGCAKCHEGGKPGPVKLDKDKAHALCINCHKEKAKGPVDGTKCAECHKK